MASISSFPHSFFSPLLLSSQPTRLMYPLLNASLGSLLAKTTDASRSAGSAMETMTVWTTAMRLLSCVVSYYTHIRSSCPSFCWC